MDDPTLADPGIDPDPPQEPPAGSQPSPVPDPEVERLKSENASYREQLRHEQAKRLAAEHGLTPTMADLLSSVDRDKQEERAKALAEEMRTKTQPEPSPATDPKVEAGMAAMQQTPGTPPPPTEDYWSEVAVLKRMAEAKTQQDMDRIMAEAREHRRAERRM